MLPPWRGDAAGRVLDPARGEIALRCDALTTAFVAAQLEAPWQGATRAARASAAD